VNAKKGDSLALDDVILEFASDGTVEALISGPTPAVETFVALAMRGPAGSKIKNVELHNTEPPAEKGFHRRPSV
jgi:acylphosphatase